MDKLIASLIFMALATSCQKALKDANDYLHDIISSKYY